MRISPLNPRERRLLASEANAALRDVRAVIGSLLAAFSFLGMVGVEFSMPPIRLLMVYWHDLAHAVWNVILFWYPFDLEIPATDELTYFTVMGGLFLRGNQAAYAALSRFSIEAQDFCARMLVYATILVMAFKREPQLSDLLWVSATRLPPLVPIIAFLVVVAVVFGALKGYFTLLRRVRMVPRVVRRPFLVFVFPVAALLVGLGSDAVSAAQEPYLAATSGVPTLIQASVTLVGLATVLIYLFVFPFVIWYPRVFLAFCVSVGALLVADGGWILVTGIAGRSL